jgi:hypothetical protein
MVLIECIHGGSVLQQRVTLKENDYKRKEKEA